MKLSLRAGERIFINGAVLRVDRKVSLEFLNDVTFLLESHVLQAEEAVTPLRQLYFIIQTMAIDPASLAISKELFDKSGRLLAAAFQNREVLEGLRAVDTFVAGARYYEALKTLRGLFPIEDGILGRTPAGPYLEDDNDKREVA